MVVAMGDNCSFNQPINAKLGVSLICCANHRFQLAVKEVVHENENIIKQLLN